MSVNHKLCYRHFAAEDLNDNRFCGGHCTKKPHAVPVIKHITDLEELVYDTVTDHFEISLIGSYVTKNYLINVITGIIAPLKTKGTRWKRSLL